MLLHDDFFETEPDESTSSPRQTSQKRMLSPALNLMVWPYEVHTGHGSFQMTNLRATTPSPTIVITLLPLAVRCVTALVFGILTICVLLTAPSYDVKAIESESAGRRMMSNGWLVSQRRTIGVVPVQGNVVRQEVWRVVKHGQEDA